MSRLFILSPASCTGLRAQMVLRPEAAFDVARRLREKGIAVGELFTFLSGLYFRGKLAYARTFADPPSGCPGVLVITPCRGLLSPGSPITPDDLRRFAATDIRRNAEAYREPLCRDAAALETCIADTTDVVLLGSIATDNYVKVLLECFGPHLRFPREFVGRGDMSRGGLLLRHAEDGTELEYIPVQGAVVHGKRPPRLQARARDAGPRKKR